MLYQNLATSRFITLSLFLGLLLCQGAFAVSPHLPCPKQGPSLVVRYQLTAIRETDLAAGALTKHKLGPSLGPSINNAGAIVGNRQSGGFVYVPSHGEYTPAINGARLNFYDINNGGDILVSITRDPRNVEWLIWPVRKSWCCPRIPISTLEVESYKVHLWSLNDQRTIAGEAHPDERFIPVVWETKGGLYRLGYFQKGEFLGHVRTLNNNGLIAGQTSCYLENFPFVWNGMFIMDLFKQRSRFQPPSNGKIQFEDIALTDDGTLYGTYWINTEFFEQTAQMPVKYKAFAWDPLTSDLTFLDMDGMRIATANNSHRLVGSLNGKAAFADRGFKPVELATAIDAADLQGWELLEATDINDYGQIVGYGLLNGKMHIFLASPL